ncbi:cysteine proteinase 2 isoform X2 [Diabrotica virgifera virgifera]|uniref:Cathepsin propeptide inhibitor domain-containing protein n=1 Tax=Diabrotica virgifera virgifera TaxID=50390 RepID=A0ABM5KSL3_DIAVI|nr:cysteine proteinase 2 isoform X2 [Diabrotica virgifera virgifera]
MEKSIIIFIVVFLGITLSLDEVEWKNFKNTHFKRYNDIEDKLRFKVFQDSLRVIEAHNDKYNKGEVSYFLKTTQYADWTNEEFRSLLNSNLNTKLYTKNISRGFNSKSKAKIPPSVDWRNEKAVTEVKDEGTCGCGWAFSAIFCEKKFQVDQHLNTATHKLKLKKMALGPVQQSINTSLQNVQDQDESKKEKRLFNQDLCKALLTANIPLKKLQNIHFRQFLQKYCNFNIPNEATLRKGNVNALYDGVIEEIKVSLSDNTFYVIVDESTDACGRYMVHLIIGALKEDEPGNLI